MKYPSLINTALTVVDARNPDGVPMQYLDACLAALREPIDSHFLIACSSTEKEQYYEEIGELAGQDFFFHAETVLDSDMFISRCSHAKTVVLPARYKTHYKELETLITFPATIIMADSLAKDFGISQAANVLLVGADARPSLIKELLLRTSGQSN